MRFGARVGRKAVVAAAVAGAVVLGGCAQSPSNAAVVEGTKISRDQYQSAVETGANLNLSADIVLSLMIQGEIAEQVAADRGIEITDGDRAKVLEQAAPGALEQVPQARELLHLDADRAIVVQRVGEEEFTQAVTDADVTVNPRFGSWDPQQALQVIPGTGSLSQQANRQ